MATGQLSDYAAFSWFVSERLGPDLGGKTLEDAVAAFRQYQHEVMEVRAKLAIAEEQSARGESSELDDEQFWAGVESKLDALGIPE